MRIKCPYCGERDASEFAYLGAADPKRPDPEGKGAARRSTTTSICGRIRRAYGGALVSHLWLPCLAEGGA